MSVVECCLLRGSCCCAVVVDGVLLSRRDVLELLVSASGRGLRDVVCPCSNRLAGVERGWVSACVRSRARRLCGFACSSRSMLASRSMSLRRPCRLLFSAAVPWMLISFVPRLAWRYVKRSRRVVAHSRLDRVEVWCMGRRQGRGYLNDVQKACFPGLARTD